MIFSKKEILTAINKESLDNENWVSLEKNRAGVCKVCALGAVLRRRGISDQKIPSAAVTLTSSRLIGSPYNPPCHTGSIDLAIFHGGWMTALSIKFEKLCRRYKSMRKVKQLLCRFVEKEFPDQFEYKGF